VALNTGMKVMSQKARRGARFSRWVARGTVVENQIVRHVTCYVKAKISARRWTRILNNRGAGTF